MTIMRFCRLGDGRTVSYREQGKGPTVVMLPTAGGCPLWYFNLSCNRWALRLEYWPRICAGMAGRSPDLDTG